MTDFDASKVAEIHQHLHSHLPSESALRVKALETLLVDKGLVNPQTIDAWVEAYTEEIGPRRGARVVAKAWCDPEYKARLLRDAPAAIDELGFLGKATAHLKVVENTDEVHNLVVCTLCSCYPFSILGIAPPWYKVAAYRSRAVRDPRGVLLEFGVDIDVDVEIHVWDSTAELRYLVLPQRPPGTEDMSEDELAALVSRNSMIGTDRELGVKIEGGS
ncbi:MAG: nitrile hydratase subunit alpha [Gammaproteobacteria bacterium]|nr:nitrile hydratase subunit alpha [Gammaproteobacteria bacterium]MDH3856956.1 nitrile hydratase subunit alpha [Gammaproteobacteria bacterium]